MKKILSILSVILILVTLVSCDGFNLGESGASKGLASISFLTGETTKALTVSTDVETQLVTNYKWYYKATKLDGGPNEGSKTEWTLVSSDSSKLGIQYTISGFSVGNWSFDLAKQLPTDGQDVGDSHIVKTGIVADLLPGVVNNITVDVASSLLEDGTGTLKIGPITVPGKNKNDNNAAVTWTYSIDSSTPTNIDFSSTTTINNVASGSHEVSIVGTYTSGTYSTTRTGQITIPIYKDFDTTVSGSIDDLQTAIMFVGDIYKLSYDANISTGSYEGTLPSSMSVGGDVTVGSAIARDDFQFLGWNTKADGTGETYQPNDTISVFEDTILYAKWYCFVTYNKNDSTSGEAPTDTTKYKGGDKATIIGNTGSLVKTGSAGDEWVFLGWTEKEDGTGTIYKAGQELTLSGDVTLYAKWDQIKGTASTLASSGRAESSWVKLWQGGPKFAEFNIGSTINDYADASTGSGKTLYSTAAVGGYYEWGGFVSLNSSKTAGTDYDDGLTDIQGKTGTTGDTAKNIWGQNWKMPTSSQISSLLSNCTWTRCTGVTPNQYVDGCLLVGWKITGKNEYSSVSIFLPNTGGLCANEIGNFTTESNYWTSSPSDSTHAYRIDLNGTVNYQVDGHTRSGVCSIRAILADEL